MDEILYFYDEDENNFKGVDGVKQMGNIRQVCKGLLKNQYQILSENGCVYYLEYGKSFYRIPTWNNKVKQIVTNESVTLLLCYSGQLYGFGDDKQQLGLLGNEKCYSSQSVIKIGNDFKSVSLSQNIGCGIDYKGQGWIWGNSPLGRSDIPVKIDGRFIKICAAKDYVILTDQQAQVNVLCETFKLSNEYFTCQNIWTITTAQQIDTNYLIVNEIVPNDRYSILLSNKNRMFLLINNNGRYIIRRIAINIRIHHLQQTNYYIYCYTQEGRLIKIDKANLYSNETNELQSINEQIRFQLPEFESKHLSSIQPIITIKYPFNLPAFIVDKRRFNEAISILRQQHIDVDLKAHLKSTQNKLQIIKQISPIKNSYQQQQQQQQQLFSSRIISKSRNSLTSQMSRFYYSPQQNDKIHHFQTPKKQNPTTPSKYIQTYINQNSPSPNVKTFIQEQKINQISTVKKANLIRLLVQDIQKSINNLNNLQQVPVDIRDRTHSRRSSSVHLDQVQSMIVELGNSQQRNNSHEKINKLNNSFNSKISQHDNKNTNASSLFQSEQDLIDELRASEPLDMIEEEYLEYDEETDQIKRILIRRPIDQDYEYGNNLKLNMGDGKILLSRKLVNVIDENGWNRQNNGQLKKIISEQEPQQYLEEEILIENPKTGQITRKIIRIPYNNQSLTLGEGLNEINNQGQKIIGRRIVDNQYSTEQLEQEGWVNKESKLERILGNREPNKYVEEEILEINPLTGLVERKIIRRKYDKNRKLEEGQKIISSKIVDNIQSSIQLAQDGWNCNFNLGIASKLLSNQNQTFYIEEEILLVQSKKQDRKLIRKIYFDEQSINQIQQEFGENLYEIQVQGIRIIARRIIKEETQIDRDWKYYPDKKYWEKIISQGESCKFVQETIIQIDFDNYEQTKKQIRYDLKVDEKSLILGNHLDELQFDGSQINSREVGENIESTLYLREQGWIKNRNEQLEKIISIDKILNFYEEEILIQNLSAGKQQRKLIRRPILEEGEKCKLGDDLEERIADDQVIISRKIVKNDGNFENWKKNEITRNLEKVLIQSEPIEFIQEEVLTFNQQTGTVIRQLVKRPSVNKDKIQFGQLKEVDKDGNIVVKRTLVPNLKLLGSDWTRGSMGSYRQTIAEEPEEYVEEEIIVVKNGKQERKLVRRPFNQEDLQRNYGDDLNDVNENGEKIVARRVIGNDQSKDQLEQEGWKINENGDLEKKQIEPTEYLIEEILYFNKETGNYERKMIKRQKNKQDEKLNFGENLSEVDRNGNKILSRQIIQNVQSLNKQKEEGWIQSNGNYEKIINIQEPEKYIEEEVLIQKNGIQERKLIRRPYNNQQVILGENLNEDHNGIKIVSRKIVSNDQSSSQLQNQKWFRNNKGQLELQISKSEPQQFIEEEVLTYNEETGLMERKLIRRQYNQNKDGKLQIGVELNEVDSNGNKILSRQIVDNTKSFKSNNQEGWNIQNNGTQIKVISSQEPEAYIEEEILIINPKTGKQERKLIRKPYNQEDLDIGESINEINDGQRVVARRIIQNDQSIYASQNWQLKTGQEIQEIVLNEEPTQYIEEEILIKDKNGQIIRQKVRKPYEANKKILTGNIHEQLQDGSIVVNRKIVDNNFSQAEMKNWKTDQKGQLIQVINQNEPERYIEQEVLIINPKTGKQERKLIRKPYTNQKEVLGDDLNESIGPNTKVISRKIVENDHCSDDWQFNNGQFEQIINSNEPVKYLEEEVLVRNKQTGQLERKLIRKPYQKDQKLGDNLNEQQDGVTILSRKLVENRSKQGWEEKGQNLEKILNDNEVEEYIEDEIIIQNKKTGKQERKLVRRNVNDPPPQEGIVVSSKRVQNIETNEQQKQAGWIKQDGQLVKVIAKNEPTKMIIEEVLQYNDETGLMERKLIKKPYDPSNKKQEIQNGTVLSRKIVDNMETLDQGQKWILKNGQYEQILCDDEPEQFIEEEIIIINQKTGKQERKLIRRPLKHDEDPNIGECLNEPIGNGQKVIARRIIQNNQPSEELQSWKRNGEIMEKQLESDEPIKYIEEEILVLNPETKQLERVLVRRPYEPCQVGQVNETDKNGNKIVSRRVVDNVESSQNGWQKLKGILKKVVAVEPTKYIEEEVLIINQKTGKQERKLIRRPLNEGQDPGELGDSLNISTEEGYKVVSRKIVDNNQAKQAMQDWIQADGVQIKKIGVEPTKFIEEEVLILNPETGMMERKIIKKPYNPSVKVGNNLNIQDNQGNLILSRKIVENNQSTSKSQWKQGQTEILIQEEPAQYIEEEIIVVNPKNGQQERKVVRKPYYGQDIELGDELDEEISKNQHVVARRIVNNDQSLDQLKQWKKQGDELIMTLNSSEPAQQIEEEVLIRNPETGMMERKIIRRDQNSQPQYDKVISRKVVDNRKSSIVLSKQGWKQTNIGAIEVVLGEEPEQYIEEEIIQINPKTGKQERKLIRKPYYGQDIEVSDELNESIGGGQRVVARRIVDNDAQIDWEKKNNQFEMKIGNAEPIKYIEEEIVYFNPKTGMVETKIIRKPFQKNAKLGNQLNEETSDGVVLSRKVIDNVESIKKQELWQKGQDGNLMKIISTKKPDQFIEEEVITVKNGKQERKIVRKPILFDQQVEESEDLNQDIGNGQRIISRKIVQGQEGKDFELKNGVYEKQISKNEPTKFIEEEILVYNEETGMMDRKLIRRPFTEGQRKFDENGNKVLSSKVIDNNKSVNQMQDWNTLQNGQKEIILSAEPEQYYEEEVLIFKNGKAERKVIRKPYNGQQLKLGEDLDETNGQMKVLSRKIVNNDLTSTQKQEWNEQQNGCLEKVISQGEPIKYIEEEILVCNEETGIMERKIIRRPFTQKDGQLKQGNNLSEINQQGDRVVSRKIVENNLTEEKKQEWMIDKNGKMEKTISQEPLQYIEEEVIVVNKNGKQERKLVRKPYNGQELQMGEELSEGKGNTKVVARRLIDNQQSSEELQKWQRKGEQMELVLVKEEPTQVVVEEVLVYNAEKGVMERKLITRPLNSKEDEDPNVKVLSRRVVDNLKCQQLGEQIIAEEPEQYIEEEVITINPRTGKQERKLIRRPYYGEEVELGDEMDEIGQKGERIISRRIVENEETAEGLKEWKQQSDGSLVKIIAQNEPVKYIEEEILVLNPETQQMERKLIRKPYNPNAKLGNVKETDQDGNVIVSRKVVENKQSQRRWTVKQDGKLEQVISKAEPIQFIEEEVLVLNPKTNQMERKFIRRPMKVGDSELDTGDSLNESRGNLTVVARRVVQNEQSQDQLQKEGWVIDNKSGQMELVSKEPVKFIEEEILVQTEDGQLVRKLIRKPYNPKVKIGNNLQETDNDGNRILSRTVVENNQSLASLQANGWNVQKQEKVISQEPLQYIEEEVIIVNPKTGKQERKIIRKPYYNEDLAIGDELNEVNGGQRVLARRIVDNEQSLNQLNQEGWKIKDGNLEITMEEPSQMIEEELLVYNEESGLYERKLVRRQYDAKRDSTLQLGQLKEFDQNGNKILSRKIVENIESSQQLQKGGWINNQGVLEKIINVQEPDKFIEEEVLIINPKTGKQERRLTRRPYLPGDEKMEMGDDILDQQGGRKVVSRRIVENDSSSEFQLQQGWKQISAGMFEVQLCAAEPVKYVEEEILIVNKQTKQMQRKLIRRQYTIKDQNLKFGDDIKEKDSQGNRVLARRLIENVQSLTQLKKEGWTKLADGTLEKILSAIAQKFIEEEILVYNPRTGKQERRLTRRPVMMEDDKFKIGDQINEQLNDGTKVVARRIVDGDFAFTSWQQNDQGVLIHQISEAEPLKYIEEEVLQVNPETGMMERKLIRRPYNDQKVNFGKNINENKDDGTIVLSRKLVENNESLAQWRRESDGKLVKVINHEEPEQYVEEEIITVNSKTGKQERKLIRRPLTEDDRNAIIGDQIIDEMNNGQKVVSRKIVSNLCSSEDWKQNEDGHFEIVVAQQEPIKFIEEEVLQYNEETGMMERKLIRRVFSAQAQLGNDLQETDERGNIVISRRVVENLLSSEQQKKDGWKQNQGNLELLLNAQESLQMVEEQILIKNEETGKQEIVLRRRPYVEGEEPINPSDGLLLSRKIIKNNQSQGQLFNDGWSRTNGQLEKKINNVINPILSNKLIPDDPTSLYYLEEDHILTNPNTQEQEIHELKFPYQSNQHLKIGENLRERDDTGNQIIARKIVTNLDPDYNPYQDVEEITEIIGSGKDNEFYAIQKLVNITEVIISKNLNEKQPNGFIIRSRIVINEYQKTQQQGWRRLSDSEIPQGIRQWNQNKRSMYQIDEDSQEHRDSQYRSIDEQNQIRILDQKLSVNGKYVEEEILIKNQHTNKYERRLQRRYTNENTFGEDLDELIQDVKYLARQEVSFQLELTKQGWIEIGNHVFQRVIAKNETLQMIEEEFNNKEKHIQMFILKPYKNEQVQIGEMDELQENGLHLVRRQIINNRSLAYYKNNDFIKNKDGTYIKQIKGGITMKIPKYQEQNFVRRPTQRLSQIQLIEQRGNNDIIKIGVTENGQDEPAIVNKTTNSDISETDKMFIKQLERGNKNDRSKIYQNILNDEQLRGRINSDKNNKSPSTPYSECAIPNRAKLLSKVLNRFIKTSLSQAMNQLQLIYLAYRQKKRQIYQRNSTNLTNCLANLFYRQSFDMLIEHMQKNVIEFDEDDVIKYNEMLDENKIIAMEIQPGGNEGQAAEPVELNLTPPEKKRILKIKPKGSPETKMFGSSSQHENAQPFQRKSVVHNTMKVQNPFQRSAGRASTVIKPNTFQSSQSLKPTNQLARGSVQNISVPFGLQQPKPNPKKQTTKIKETQDKSNSQSNKHSQTPLSQSYATISQNQSQASIQKQISQEQLAQIQKNKIASQFKRMGSVQLSGAFKKP
ncbi:unnamed protein product [Paramecium sonneborni]|uniref:Uncharacterized protein n=1 Tax=Paramecium sonneborni TaxID=65129 RepID=A0A8S1MRD8_9CILI|nr:unnamed protein product [Paramecium sonneborni]